MGRIRSMDDVRSAQFVFTKSIEAQLPELPSYIREQKAALDESFEALDAAHRARVCVGVEKQVGTAQSDAWTSRASSVLSRAKLFLRATAKEHVREYFPERPGNAARKIDKLHDVARILTVSEHFAHAHLGAFKDELAALKAEGEAIFRSASISLIGQKTEVERLRELRTKWEIQYQRLKYLIRGCFHGTSTDCSKFFDAPRLVKTSSADTDEAPRESGIASA